MLKVLFQALPERIRDLVEPDELPDSQHLRVVPGGARVQPLNNRGNVAEDAGIHQSCISQQKNTFLAIKKNLDISFWRTAHQHDADSEDFLRVGVGGDVPESDTGQRREREVQGRNVAAFYAGPAGGVVGHVGLVRVPG